MFDKRKYDGVKEIFSAFNEVLANPKLLKQLGSAIDDNDTASEKTKVANKLLNDAQDAQAKLKSDEAKLSKKQASLETQAEEQAIAKDLIIADRAKLDKDLVAFETDKHAALIEIARQNNELKAGQVKLTNDQGELLAAQDKLFEQAVSTEALKGEYESKIQALQALVIA